MKWINMAECGVQSPHEPHSWREGFLWHSKKSCKGMSHIEAVSVRDEQLRRAFKSGLYGVNPNQKKTERGVVYSKAKPHRHRFFLSRLWSTAEELVFICDANSAGCKVEYRFERDTFWPEPKKWQIGDLRRCRNVGCFYRVVYTNDGWRHIPEDVDRPFTIYMYLHHEPQPGSKLLTGWGNGSRTT